MSASTVEAPHEYAAHAIYRELLRSWNKRDARGFAAQFSERGRLVGLDGHEVTGRFGIEIELARMFESYPTRPLIGIVRDVTLLAQDVGMVAAAAGMYAPGGYRVDPAVNMLQTLIVVRERSRWRVMSYQCTRAAFHGRPDLAQQLTLDLDRALRRSAAATTRS